MKRIKEEKDQDKKELGFKISVIVGLVFSLILFVASIWSWLCYTSTLSIFSLIASFLLSIVIYAVLKENIEFEEKQTDNDLTDMKKLKKISIILASVISLGIILLGILMIIGSIMIKYYPYTILFAILTFFFVYLAYQKIFKKLFEYLKELFKKIFRKI